MIRQTIFWTVVALVAGCFPGPAAANSGAKVSRTTPPAWAADAVWYQIFPERFRNGDPRNDPQPRDIAGSWPADPNTDWKLAPWGADWYKLQPWEATNGKDFYYNVQRRRYGGDLQGVIDKLDYLAGLGVNTIYFNPLFESPSLHKYDATFYHHVDNNFGPDPDGDRAIWAVEDHGDPAKWKWTAADKLFLKLIEECHKRKIRIVIDGVFNHVGQTFWAFEDVRKNGPQSKYASWFYVDSFDDPATPESEFKYRGWFDVPELPELKDEGDTLHEGPRQHIRAVVRRWMDPNGDGNPADGIDGWRLDVADMVGHGFWKEFRTWVLDINPDAYITGEVWWDKYPDKMFNAEPWLRGDEFDAVMNYRWATTVKAFFIDRANVISATEFDRRLTALRQDYRSESNYALQNLMDSHDTDRLASMIVNPDRKYDHKISPKEDPGYSVRAPNAADLRLQRLVAAFQFTHVGAPMIYYGGETGMWGADDPDPRKPMIWPDIRFDDEATDPLGRPRPKDRVRFDKSLHDYYVRLGSIRNAHPALRRGTIDTVVADDAKRLYGFSRKYGGDEVIAVFNASPSAQDVSLPHAAASARELLGGKRVRQVNGSFRLRIPAGQALILAVGQ